MRQPSEWCKRHGDAPIRNTRVFILVSPEGPVKMELEFCASCHSDYTDKVADLDEQGLIRRPKSNLRMR